MLLRRGGSWLEEDRLTASDAAPDDLIVVPLLRGARNADQVRGLIDAVSHDITASLLVLNEAGNPDTSVLTVFDGDRDDLAAAVELARDFRCPLTVFAVGKTADVAQRRVDEVQAYGEMLATKPANALAAIRRCLIDGGSETFDAGLEIEREQAEALAAHPNFEEGVAAFLEKRKPDWA